MQKSNVIQTLMQHKAKLNQQFGVSCLARLRAIPQAIIVTSIFWKKSQLLNNVLTFNSPTAKYACFKNVIYNTIKRTIG